MHTESRIRVYQFAVIIEKPILIPFKVKFSFELLNDVMRILKKIKR